MSTPSGCGGFGLPRQLAVGLVVFAIGTDSFALPGLLPLLTADLGLSLEGGGRLVSLYAIVFAIGAPLLCMATAARQRRTTLLLAAAMFGASSIGSALATDTLLLAACRAGTALGAGLFFPTAGAFAVELSPEHRKGTAIARVYVGMTLAMVAGVPLLTWLAHAHGWRPAFLTPGILTMVALPLLLACLPRCAPAGGPGRSERLRLLARADVLAALTTTLLGIAGSFAVYTYLGALLPAAGGPFGDRLDIILLLFGLAGLAGNHVAAGANSERRRALATMASLAGKASAFALLGLAASEPAAGSGGGLVLFAIALYGFCGWMFPPLQQARLATLAPGSVATVLSLNASFLYAGMALGALLGGSTVRYLAIPANCWTGAGLELAALGLLLSTVTPRIRRITRAQHS